MQEQDENIDLLIRALASESRGEVVSAVETLSREAEGSEAEAALIAAVAGWEEDESFAPLWAMVALKGIASCRAVPTFLPIFDSDADFYHEAASEAMVAAVRSHGDELLDQIEQYIEDRVNADSNGGYIHAYAPFAALTQSSRAKEFLMRMFEEDDTYYFAIAGDLLRFRDPGLFPLFLRRLAFAREARDTFAEREVRDACATLAGALPHEDYGDLGDEPWEKRWRRQLDTLGKSEREIRAMEKERFRSSDNPADAARAKAFDVRVEERNAIRDRYIPPPFDIDQYLGIRIRSGAEEDFDRAIRLVGLDWKWDVEAVERLIYRADDPRAILSEVIRDFSFPSEASAQEFAATFDHLLAHAPREEFGGLSVEDREIARERRPENEERDRAWGALAGIFRRRKNAKSRDGDSHPSVPAESIAGPANVSAAVGLSAAAQAKDGPSSAARAKAGRNDLCPCGSGKKYKRCHGQ